MRKEMVKELPFGKGTARVTVTMFHYGDPHIPEKFRKVECSKEVEIIKDGKVVESDYHAKVLAYSIVTDKTFDKLGLDPSKKYSSVGKVITNGEEAAIAIQNTMKELETELAKHFKTKTEEQIELEEEIARAEEVIKQAEKEGVENLLSREELEKWIGQYNDLHNEGGEGYVPWRVSKEEYQKAINLING